ncbi:MAG: uracil-DNA glycosylase [Endomicrobiales bacterium]|nr:uracil-DNA glycosylase [Endomicrobiales bacterium]
MKRSEFGKAVRQAKLCVEEETLWGETDVHAACSVGTSAKKQPVRTSSGGGEPATLDELKAKMRGCVKCRLGKSRLNLVFGTGDPKAGLMFVGEGPGFDEDHRGEPFVGRAGQLLTKIIESIGLTREKVYIANIVKCHPMIDPSDPEKRGNDRPPAPDEAEACLPFLEKQIELINPKIICTLGNSAAKWLLGMELGITKIRGKFYEYKNTMLMPTYHPAALLRNPSLKKDVWEDMKKIRSELKDRA